MNQNKQDARRRLIVSIVTFVVLLLALLLLYRLIRPETAEGMKSISITVVGKEGEKTEYETRTEAGNLKEAMEDTKGLTFGGADSEYGMMVDTVNGVRADYEQDAAYWSFFVNGESCNYGIEGQPVNDGDAFTIEYTPAME